jgi:hypothetical protein
MGFLKGYFRVILHLRDNQKGTIPCGKSGVILVCGDLSDYL